MDGKSGLTGTVVNAIFQDTAGTYWFATDQGISYFDGNRVGFFKVPGDHSNNFTCITQDRRGQLWFGSLNALVSYSKGTFVNHPYYQNDSNGSNSDFIVYSVVDDQELGLLVCTDRKGILRFRNGAFAGSLVLGGDSINGFCSFFKRDENNCIWIGTSEQGILCYQQGKRILYDSVPELKNFYFSCYQQDDGTLWFGSVNGVLLRYDGHAFQKMPVPESVKESVDFLWKIDGSDEGDIWVSTMANGVFSLKKDGTVSKIDRKKGLPTDVTYTLFVDREQNLWVGMDHNGIAILPRIRFQEFTSRLPGMEDNPMLYFVPDNQKILSAGGGKLVLSNRSGNVLNQLDDNILRGVQCCIKSGDGGYWLAVPGKGLFKYRQTANASFRCERTITSFNSTGQIPNNFTSLLEEPDGSLWAITYDYGIFLFDKNGLPDPRFSQKEIPYENVFYLKKHSEGKYLAGTLGGVFLAIYESRDGRYHSRPFHSVISSCASVMPDGLVALGTQQFGVLLFRNDRLIDTINTADGLFSDNINDLVYDRILKKLWIGTSKGMALANPFNRGQSNVINWGESDGLHGGYVNFNGLMLSGLEELFIQTPSGFFLLDYSFLLNNDFHYYPRCQINAVDVNGGLKALDHLMVSDLLREGNPLRLEHFENQIHFQLTIKSPGGLWRLQYRLVGRDTTWSIPSVNREFVLNDLSPGSYTFEYRLVKPDGSFLPAHRFPFEIQLPVWRKWWFWSFLLTALTSLVWLVSYLRNKKLLKEKEALEEKVRLRTNDLLKVNTKLSSALSDISDSIQYAKRIQQAILPDIETIRTIFPNSFLFFKPRNVVSGDFFWAAKSAGADSNSRCFCLADCTGHGVPGALMSMIGAEQLVYAFKDEFHKGTSAVLSKVNTGMFDTLHRTDSDQVIDGMEAALIFYDPDKRVLMFTGASRPLWIFRRQESEFVLEKHAPDKTGIGSSTPRLHVYSQHSIQVQPGDVVFLFSDGAADQFGGPRGKKLMSSGLLNLMLGLLELNPMMIENRLELFYSEWIGMEEQTDDILIFGFKVD